MADSTIEARNSHFVWFVTRNSAFGIPTAHATGNGNGGKAKGDLSIFGQESNPTTWRLARMNLAIRSIEGDLGDEPADSFHGDLHKDLKAHYILAE